MKEKAQIIITFLLFILFGCQPSDSTLTTEKREENDSLVENESEISLIEDSTENQKYLCARPTLVLSASEYRVKRINDLTLSIPIDLLETYGSTSPDFGLLDFNQDGHDDLFFQYYGISGAGEKNVVDVYFYDPQKRAFVDTFFRLMNPTYFVNEKIITSYYYGLGGGHAEKYRIAKGKLELIESIQIDIHSSDRFEAKFSYSQKPFKDTITVRDNMVRLPEEYRYTPIIKKDEEP